MAVGDWIERLPTPVAGVYADLLDPTAPLPRQREALYLTCYQVLRTVALTLVGQYLRQEPPPDTARHRAALARAIAGVRSPTFADWIALVRTLDKHGPALGLDFLPELRAALAAEQASRVDVPREYAADHGAKQSGLSWFEAFQWLRNGCAHAGLSTDAACQGALDCYRPVLDALLEAFAWLGEYELWALLDHPDDDSCQVVVLRGTRPGAPQARYLDAATWLAAGEDEQFSPVVLRSPRGTAQALFPLFHAHLEGEPLRYYDGHYLRDDAPLVRRLVYYLGVGTRLPVDDQRPGNLVVPPARADAGQALLELLQRREVPWQLTRAQANLWTLAETVNDYATRTLADLTETSYRPACYLDRPAVSEPLRRFACAPDSPYRGWLLTGPAGCGKTALLCALAEALLAAADQPLVFLVRGDGLTADLPGENLLLANLLHKVGLRPGDFPTFGALLDHLARNPGDAPGPGRRFVLLLDAINEAPRAGQVFQEALDLVSAARQHPWVRVVITVREEYLAVLAGRRDGTAANPFYALADLFVPPPEDLSRPLAPEDPPAWRVPPLTENEAAEVYGRHQRVRPAFSCLTPWEHLDPATRSDLLRMPLHLELWHATFAGRQAPRLTGDLDLFDQWLAETRRRFPGLWDNLRPILDQMLATGRAELGDDDAHELATAWRGRHDHSAQRLDYSPVEVAVAAGVLTKRATAEGSGYRVPYQRLCEQLLYARLREQDASSRPSSVAAWLSQPPSEELTGALARVAADVWQDDRSAELAPFLRYPELGVGALRSMLVRRLLAGEPADSWTPRQEALQANAGAGQEALAELLVAEVPDVVQGRAATSALQVLLAGAVRWLRSVAAVRTDPATESHLAEGLGRLALTEQALGQTVVARNLYEEALRLRRRLVAREPNRAERWRSLAVSLGNLAGLCRTVGESQTALDLRRQAVSARRQVLGLAPPRPADLRGLGISLNNLAGICRQCGELSTARAVCEEAVDLDRRLVADHPHRLEYQRSLGISLGNLAGVCRASGDLATARARYEESLAQARQLVAADPQRVDYQRTLGISLNNVAGVCRASGDLATARARYEESLAQARQLVASDPQRVDYQRTLGISLNNVAGVCRATGDLAMARALYEESLELARRLVAVDAERADFQKGLRLVLDNLAKLCAAAGHPDQAASLREEAEAVRRRLAAVADSPPDAEDS